MMSSRLPGDRDKELRPRMGRRRGPDRDRLATFRVQLLRSVNKMGGPKSGAGGASSRRGRIAVRPPLAGSRRCVVKARYVPMNGRGMRAAGLHLAYLERDGVERDGSPGRLYGADGTFRADEFRAPLENEPRQFRFIVSPEDGDRLDLTELARQLMDRVEKDTGRRLIWAAVNHHNTDNPHVHIVVRGVDRDGDEVRIDGRYIGREMRWRAQEIATRELGPRPEIDYSQARTVEVERERFTEIDEILAGHAGPDGRLTIGTLLAAPGAEGRVCLVRLQVLETMELARQERAGVWKLEDGWQETLHRMAERKDITERLWRIVGDRALRQRVIDGRAPVSTFEGVVAGKGLEDELAGTMFVAIMSRAGEACYVRVPPEIADGMRQGEAVRIGSDIQPWLRPADRIIARAAQDSGGLYDPVRHQRALEDLQRGRGQPDQPTPAERVTANVRRLERLARFRLAARLPDGRWRVPADLVAQLEAREKSHPQHRLRVQPVREWERDELAQAVAKRSGLAYVREPAGMRGRCFACQPTESGSEFIRIVDEAGRRFALIPKPAAGQRLEGQVVTVTRDADGRLSVQLGRQISR
jgi:type IV secretory pathway VirD2 relaxase